MITPFCPHCFAYLPTGSDCPACKKARSPLQTPAAPGEALWQVRLPGQPAETLVAAVVGGEPALLVGWGHKQSAEDLRPDDGGVSALRRADGSELWARSLGAPVTGGAAVAGDRVVAGAGSAVAALDLASGDMLWRTQIDADVKAAAVVVENRVFITASDGRLHCLSLRDGKPLAGWPVQVYPRAVPIPAPPLVLRRKGVADLVVVATNGSNHGREPGLVAAFNLQGERVWQQPAGGYVRAAPAADRNRLFVAAYGYTSGEGVLSAFDAHSGEPVWPEPFRLPGGGGGRHNLAAAPLVHDGVVYVGSLDHSLYALEARSGRLLWQVEARGGLVAQPVWVEDLLVVGGNDGSLAAIDPKAEKVIWEHGMDGAVLTAPLAIDGVLFAGARSGRVAALPWHLGQYAWAAARLEQAKRWDEAGDAWVLAGHHSDAPDERLQAYVKATGAWLRGGRPDKIAYFWLALGREQDAADAFQQAGERWRLHEKGQAARAFWLALQLRWRQRQAEEHRRCMEALAWCAGLPLLCVEVVNAKRYTVGEPGKLFLRLVNQAASDLPGGISLWVGGSLEEPVEAEIRVPMPANATWNVPLTLTPTQKQSTLVVEYAYDTGDSAYPRLQGMLQYTIEAREPKQKLNLGDVQNLVIRIEGTTTEGVAVETRDVAMMRSEGDIESISAAGDIGAIIARRGDIGYIDVAGDAGLIKGRQGRSTSSELPV